jgi:hypothetical protein
MSTNYELPEIPQQQLIKLEGISGVFNTVNSDLRVRFFSTFANSTDINYSSLLEELKPMRERISVSQIKNINQVLQRDLDDFRIANGLIPYLINEVNNVISRNHIAFFPAILGVLIPKNYLRKNEKDIVVNAAIEYPAVTSTESTFTYSTNNESKPNWKIEHIKQGERISPLAVLEFDKLHSEIIVLDGQHRANAFRVATNNFFKDSKNEIYKPYYVDKSIYPENFKTDLPVTLICFESISGNTKILPDDVSRKVFIDVNNSAKRISPSRQVLLDDRDPSSLITNTFYSIVAEKFGFEADTNELSLIHLGFDINNSLRQRTKNSIFNISSPELLKSVFDWYFFGVRGYNNLNSYLVKAEKKLKWNPAILSELLPLSRPLFNTTNDEEGEPIKVLVDNDISILQNEFRKNYFIPFYDIFNNLNFLKCHYSTTSELNRIKQNGSWPLWKNQVWESVFLGGEGLYYSFDRLVSNNNNNNRQDLLDIEKAIAEIESDFSKERAKRCQLSEDDSNLLFNGFNSLAFQNALFMSHFSYLKLKNTDFSNQNIIKTNTLDFIERMNSISTRKWANVFTEVRPLLWRGDTDPKKWPAYHKLILRLIQQSNEFYNNPAFFNDSPESQIFQNKFKAKFESKLNSDYSVTQREQLTSADFYNLHDTDITNWENSCKDEVRILFKNCFDLNPVNYDSQTLIQAIISSELD